MGMKKAPVIQDVYCRLQSIFFVSYIISKLDMTHGPFIYVILLQLIFPNPEISFFI